MQHLTVLPSLAGGILIGLSASALLALTGKIAGISGIVGGLLAPEAGDKTWRGAFVGGLLAGGFALALVAPGALAATLPRSTAALIAAGLLVGFGSRLGNGCTSGHGVCGIARGSRRSLAATITFMATGAATALVVTQFLAGTV
ncbi:MAG: YeeE/YedE family protein [Deltaproteobacteria bacterium]|nr:YeeE/YedE family protein [Deltaproteobacteria bacterium]